MLQAASGFSLRVGEVMQKLICSETEVRLFATIASPGVWFCMKLVGMSVSSQFFVDGSSYLCGLLVRISLYFKEPCVPIQNYHTKSIYCGRRRERLTVPGGAGPLSALRAHTKTPYKNDLLCRTLIWALKRGRGPGPFPAPTSFRSATSCSALSSSSM